MRRIFFILSLFIGIYSHSQNKQALLKSDSLFAKGVELYNQKDYKAAIPLFTESDKIDKAELDSTSNRREYSAMWLGSCYYKLGEIQTAQKHYQYYTIIPVDRRLTVLSDSLSAIGEKFLSEGNFEAGISAIKECGKSEKECIGENHPFYGNTLTNLLPLFCITENIKEATTCIKEIVPIYLNNPEWGKKTVNNIMPFVLAVRNKMNFDDIKDIIEINDAAALFAEPSMNAPFGSANDSIYGLIIQAGINLLTNTNDINGAIEFGEEALKKISGLNRKGNANEYIIATSLATLYAGNILIPQPYEVRKKGLVLYQRALDIALENYGEYSVETATIYLKIGNYYMRMEEERSFDKAKHWLHKAFNSRLIDSLSTNEYQTKQLIEIFANSYPLFSILSDEEYFLQTAKKITQANGFSFCENHLLMESIAEAYKEYNIGKYDKAISIYQQLINCCPEKQSKQCLSYIKSKAFTEYLNQEYDKAIADYLSIKDIMADKTVEPSISAYAQMLDLLSNCYQRINDSIQSRKYEDLSLKLREEAIQTNDGGNPYYFFQDKLSDIDNIVNIYDTRRDFRKSIDFLKIKFDSIMNHTEIPDKNMVSENYRRIGDRYVYLYDSENAHRYLNKAMTMITDTLDGYTYGGLLHSFSRLYEKVSIEPELSLQHSLHSVQVMSDFLIRSKDKLMANQIQVEFDMICNTWDKCYELFDYLGNSSDALACLDKKMDFIVSIKGEKHPMYIQTKSHKINKMFLHYAFSEERDIQKCRALNDSLLAILEHHKNDIYYDYSDIAMHYSIIKDTTNAILYHKKYLEELKRELSPNHSNNERYIETLTDIAELEGEENYIKQLKNNVTKSSQIGELRNLHFWSLCRLAELYRDKGELATEQQYWEKAISADIHNEYIGNVFKSLFDNYMKQNKEDKLLAYFRQGTNAITNRLKENFRNATEADRERIWEDYKQIPYTLGEYLLYRYHQGISPGEVYNNLLFRKNILLNSSISAINLIKHEGDSLLIKKYERMLSIEQELDKGDSYIQEGNRKISREQAKKIADRFNTEIMQRAAILGDFTQSLECSWQDIQKELKPQDLAVEFTCFPIGKDSIMYAAITLKSKGMPQFIPLCEQKSIEEISDIYSTSTLYNLLWKPILANSGNLPNIYFTPDGILHNIGIEYTMADSIPLQEKYNLYRLSSTKLLAQKKNKNDTKKAILYGGLQYDADSVSLIKEHLKYATRSYSVNLDTIIIDSLTLRGGVSYLPATLTEIKNIHASMQEINIQSELYSELQGTEESFKSLSGKQIDILHIATHGFYVNQKRSSESPHTPINKGMSKENSSLKQSGLLMSGANIALKKGANLKGVEDGILTAQEISTLDLRGLELAVLSACQTGIGDIAGDGVFGLQRGFKKAGANTLLMSLWKVDDNATRLLMTEFYKNLLAGESKFESLRKAQKYVRDYEEEIEIAPDKRWESQIRQKMNKSKEPAPQKLKKIKRYASPYYWAAFILLDAID